MAAKDFQEVVLANAPWSFSKVNTLSCGKRFHFQYVLKKRGGRAESSSLVGTAAHSVLEAGLKMPGFDLDAAFVQASDAQDLTSQERDTLRTKMTAIREFIARIEKYKKEHGVIHDYIEHKIAFDVDFKPAAFLDDKKVLMRGVFDLALRTPDDYLGIIDHKSGKKKPILEHREQLYTYMLMAVIAWPWLKGAQCGINYIGDSNVDWFPRPDGTRGAWTRAEIVNKTLPWMIGFLNKSARKLKVIASGEPVPETSPLCAFCGFEAECPEGQVAANAYRVKRAAREKKSKGFVDI